MYITNTTDVINLLKVITKYRLEQTNIRYYYNMCYEIDNIPVYLLVQIKSKLNAYKK